MQVINNKIYTMNLFKKEPSYFFRTLTRGAGARSAKLSKLPWWKKPIVQNAFYTDLQRGSWHIGFYTLVS